MAVALDVLTPVAASVAASATVSNGTSLNSASLTVGGAATGLLVVLVLDSLGGSDPTSVACTWNSVGMTQLAGPVKMTGATNTFIYVFGLGSPATGAHTANATWTGSCDAYISVESFTGTDTSTPFTNVTTLTDQAGTSASITPTFIANGTSIGVFSNTGGGWSGGMNPSPWWIDQSLTHNVCTANSTSNTAFTNTMVSGTWSGVALVAQPPGSATAWSAEAILGGASSLASNSTAINKSSALLNGTGAIAALVTSGFDVILGDRVLQAGLAALAAETDKIFVCSAIPTTYTEASSTFALGNKNWGAGNAFGGPAAASPNGRKVTSVAIADGAITASGTVFCWAAVDSATSRLLATGALSGGMAVTNGWIFTLESFAVHMPAS